MKYVLVDSHDYINTSVDLGSDVGVTGAKTYFKGVKRLEEKEFDELWRVMTEQEHKRLNVHNETIREYEEFGDWLDIEKS
jgi:hypothetical protein